MNNISIHKTESVSIFNINTRTSKEGRKYQVLDITIVANGIETNLVCFGENIKVLTK